MSGFAGSIRGCWMRSWESKARPFGLVGWLVCIGLVLIAGPPALAEKATEPHLMIWPDPAGGVRMMASVQIPASPQVVQAVLTDYQAWPSLFGSGMRLAHLERANGRVVTDLYIKRPLLPGELRLLCETEERPDGGSTRLVGGDFRRYLRTWTLRSDGEPEVTRADFEVLVEVKTWMPDWLVMLSLRHEMEDHFEILRARAVERAHAH